MSVPSPFVALTVGLGVTTATLSAVPVIAAIVSRPPVVSVTVGAETFNLKTRTTSFDELEADPDFDRLVPFFEDADLAQELASLVGPDLGLPSLFMGSASGPFFVIEEGEFLPTFEGEDVEGVAFFESVDTPGVLALHRFAVVDYVVVDLEPDTTAAAVPVQAFLPEMVDVSLTAVYEQD
ncbi:hypothetical protein N836_01700 [Leptolyngbya sp. Heron Island J]|uniref:hypothetical protein n=1 Tax=Leptolyngbya sp. Heron Island J TaxID=1385935 RepID=UPI0003B9E328|nr:hypothetical protein [Leptolyngbya sp. Heron Island J]ESA33510.1 hypothetical protein N836_01700 [Leptolyngbya sp. Heron Island J]